MGGEIGGFRITQGFLFAVSLYIAIASVMVFLTLVLRPDVARWVNVVLAVLYAVSIRGLRDRRDAYFILLSVLEVALLLLIVRYAWIWPRTADAR